jgi:photosystem II stability/assembly factor-like uncharacterized protein
MSHIARRLTWPLALLALVLASAVPLRTHAAPAGLAPGEQGESTRSLSTDLYAGLAWRNIGPFHGGRISAVSGVIGQPGTFYVGTPMGGVWRTTSAGVTWVPIVDQLTDIDGVGAVVAAPSDQNIIYVGSGDPIAGGDGNGMYKSSDGGQAWTHMGLEAAHRISKMVIDPKDPNLVVVGAVGDGNNGEAGGIYRTIDGGRTWKKVLTPAGTTAVRDLVYDFSAPNLMFATTIGGGGGFGGGGGGRAGNGPPPAPAKLFKSSDEGQTWTEVTTLPRYNGRISVAVAMHTNGQRLYVVGSPIDNGSGLYRSDDGGATWKHMAGNDTRVANGQGNYQSGVFVDPQNPDVVYVTSIALMRSTDGGVTFESFKGAPGGEDYHMMWIDPTNGQRMLLGVDQGPTVTLDGGKTWSLWYPISIAQVYHVSTDSRYPYWVMGAQQDTGAVMTRSRGDFGQINWTDWSPLPSSEFGTLTADPLHPEIIYGVGYGPGGGGSGMVKINMATGQWQNVAPNFGANAQKYRQARDFWKKFDPFDQTAMYVGYQCLLVTRDGARTWKAASPDLTMAKADKPLACGVPLPPPPPPAAGAPAPPAPGGGRGGGPAIVDFVLSTAKRGAIWTASTNGQINTSVDAGLHWTNVSNLTDAANVNFNTIDGAHHDVNTVYVSGRLGGGRGAPEGVDTNVPLIWRTHDGGKTWTKIVDGLPKDERTGSWVNVVREDPKQKGLLYAGTETTVYVSFDDGDHWQSLRQNLPSTSIRDLVFHTDDHMNDVVIGTYGRGFWVLDDVSPLREIAANGAAIASAPAYFFKPGDAIRARLNANWDQPMTIEMPHAPNAPYGAILYYHLSKAPTSEIRLQVFDAAGRLVRTITSTPPPPITDAIYPDYWLKTPASRSLPTAVGTNRINWDLQYDDPPAFQHDLENQMNMVAGLTSAGPHGPQVSPGTYTLKLTVDGTTYTQTVAVHNDPRVGERAATLAALKSQARLTQLACQGMKDTFTANEVVAALRSQLVPLMQQSGDVGVKAKELDTKLATFGGVVEGRGGRGGGAGFGGGRGGNQPAGAMQSFIQLNNSFNTLVSMMQVGLDMAPTPAQVDTWEADCKNYNTTLAAWKKTQAEDLASFSSLKIPPTTLSPASCAFAASAPGGR